MQCLCRGPAFSVEHGGYRQANYPIGVTSAAAVAAAAGVASSG